MTSPLVRGLARLSFRTGIHNHVALVEPERHDITNFGQGTAITSGRRLSQSERGACRCL